MLALAPFLFLLMEYVCGPLCWPPRGAALLHDFKIPKLLVLPRRRTVMEFPFGPYLGSL